MLIYGLVAVLFGILLHICAPALERRYTRADPGETIHSSEADCPLWVATLGLLAVPLVLLGGLVVLGALLVHTFTILAILVRAVPVLPVSGAVLCAGIMLHCLNVVLIRHYVEKEFPGLLEFDWKVSRKLVRSGAARRYLWEYTAGMGIVPRWVSVIGLLAAPLFLIGFGGVIVGLIVRWVR